MPDYTTEARTYVGEAGTIATDGYLKFRVGVVYTLRFERLATGTVAVYLDHLACGPVIGPVEVSAVQFEKWWVK